MSNRSDSRFSRTTMTIHMEMYCIVYAKADWLRDTSYAYIQATQQRTVERVSFGFDCILSHKYYLKFKMTRMHIG